MLGQRSTRMKRNRFIAAALAAAAVAAGAADLEVVNLAAVPGVERYGQQLSYLEQHLDQLRGWVPDSLWKYPVGRRELSQNLAAFYTLLDRDTAHPDSQDLYLLKGIVGNFLYNLEAEEYYELAVASFTHVETIPGRDERYLWQLGNLCSDADLPYQAVDRFREVERTVAERRVSPLFWADYAAACMLASMPSKARMYFERSAWLTGRNLADDSRYQSLLQGISYPKADAEIPAKELFVTLERQDGLGILSRPLGIWIPVDGEWRFKAGDFAKRKAVLSLSPPRIRHPTAGDIGYTIAVFFDLTGGDAALQWETTLPNARRVRTLPVSRSATVIEYSDPGTYPHIGGAHGYAVVVRADCPEAPGAAIEAPMRRESSGERGGPVFYRLSQGSSRFEDPISYVFFLDTCNFIFEPSVKVFTDLLNALIVE
jgi:hypothetical protein